MSDNGDRRVPSVKKCSGVLVKEIDAPLPLVWSIVRDFGKPQTYKMFVQSASIISGDGDIGSVREVHLASGLPAETSVERLDVCDDNLHVLSFTIIGGDHMLQNYHATMLLLHNKDDHEKTTVMESYKVDGPVDNTEEETCYFINNIIRWNHERLAYVAERMNSPSPYSGSFLRLAESDTRLMVNAMEWSIVEIPAEHMVGECQSLIMS